MASIRENTKRDGSKTYYVLWRDPDLGKQTSMSFATRGQAENMRALLNANGQRLSVVERGLEKAHSTTTTVADLMRWYLRMPSEANEQTRRKYHRLFELHVLPHIGAVPAAKLVDEVLADWTEALARNGLSRKTILNVTSTVSAAYKLGVMKGKVAGNPFDGFHVAKDGKRKRRAVFLTRDEYDLLRSFIPAQFQLLTDFLVQTGLRFGEATALSAEDVELDAEVPVIHVTKAWKGTNGGDYFIGEPKSEFGVRDVAITRDLAERLRPLLKRPRYLFDNLNGGQLRPGSFYKPAWKPARDAAVDAGLTKWPRVHDLRHTHASWLLQERVPAFVVSRRLGHASTAFTTRIYGHITPEGHEVALEGLERALRR